MVQMMDTMMVHDSMASMRPVREVEMRISSRPNVYPVQQPAMTRQSKPTAASKPTKPPESWTVPKPTKEYIMKFILIFNSAHYLFGKLQ